MKDSPRIFHGPNALTTSQLQLTLARPPFGTSKAEVMSFVDSARIPPPSTGTAILLGPLDDVLLGSSDVLLKTLEENPEFGPVLALWANDIGSVSRTIRSRCLDVWCHGSSNVSPDLDESASSILECVGTKNYLRLVSEVQRWKDDLTSLVMAISSKLVGNARLWSTFRPVTRMRTLTVPMVVSALIGGGS